MNSPTPALPSLRDLPALRAHLGAWYDEHKREMPWRSNPSPYAVWMSEIMLQQTRVDTVIPYFRRFLDAYPRVEDLAQAPESQVLGRWAGLGYYRRARALHAAAKVVAERGAFPNTLKGLLALPGVGPYTAGAIASIAFGLPTPLVDGNVARVLSRLLALEAPVDKPQGLKHLWAEAERLVDPGDPGRHNQGLMELGALICSPRAPRCHACPLRASCQAAAQGSQERYPIKAPRKRPRPMAGVAGVFLDSEGALLLGRRPEGALLGGLWELPGQERGGELSASAELIRAFTERLGVGAQVGSLLGEVTHVFTHRKLSLQIFTIEQIQGDPRPVAYPEIAFVRAENLGEFPLSRLTQKVLELVDFGQEPQREEALEGASL